MGGSSSPPIPPNTTTQTRTTQELPDWIQPFATLLLNEGTAVARRPFQDYNAPRQAGMNEYDLAGFEEATRTGDRARKDIQQTRKALRGFGRGDEFANNSYRDQGLDQSYDTARGVAQGSGLNPAVDPGLNRSYQMARDVAQGSGLNPAVDPGLNRSYQMARDVAQGSELDPATNPWLDQTYAKAARGVTDQYSRGTAAQTDAAAARAGALGGSAYNEQKASNEFDLGTNLSELATSIYGGNYEQARNRQMAALGLMPQIAGQREQTAEQARQRQMAALGLMPQIAGQREQTAEQARQRQMEALGLMPQIAGQRQSAYEQARGRQFQALSGLPTLASSEYGSISDPLFGLAARQRELEQPQLDLAYENWREARDYPLQQIDIAGSTLGQSMGRSGTSTITQPYFAPQRSRVAGGLGGALSGFALGSSFNNPYAALGGAAAGGALGAYA